MQASIIVVLALAATVYCQGYGFNFGIPNGISQPNPNTLSQYIVGRPKVYTYNTQHAIGRPGYPGLNNHFPQIIGGGGADSVPILRFAPPQPQKETPGLGGTVENILKIFPMPFPMPF